MNIKINRSVGDGSYTVGIGEGMTMDIKSILRSDFRRRYLYLTAQKTGYLDESEFMEKHRTQTITERARSLALFKDQQDEAKYEAFIEACVTGWNIEGYEFSTQAVKDLFLTEENKHQINDLIAIASTEEYFWIKEEKKAEEQIKKS